MTSPPDEEKSFSLRSDELPLSATALAQLLHAVVQRGKPFRFRARGWSMAPFIKDGDVLTVAPLTRRAPAVGDVVAFVRDPDRLVVHRVVGVRDGAYVIQGDNLLGADDTVPAQNVMGRVIRVERDGRPVRLGMGPERRLVARLTSSGLFVRLVIPLWLRVRFIFRRPR